jgi:hypothetical protein
MDSLDDNCIQYKNYFPQHKKPFIVAINKYISLSIKKSKAGNLFRFISNSFRISYNSYQLRTKTKTPWPESANELYRPSDRRLSTKIVSTYADRGSHVVSVTDPYGRSLGFPDQSRYFSFK